MCACQHYCVHASTCVCVCASSLLCACQHCCVSVRVPATLHALTAQGCAHHSMQTLPLPCVLKSESAADAIFVHMMMMMMMMQDRAHDAGELAPNMDVSFLHCSLHSLNSDQHHTPGTNSILQLSLHNPWRCVARNGSTRRLAHCRPIYLF